MALTFQGLSKGDIDTGIVTKIEIAAQSGTPSYLDAGDFTDCVITIEGLTMPHEGGTMLTYALRFSASWSLVQTLKTAELAAMAGTSGTGIYETDVQIKFTLATGRTITLGAVTGVPMRMTMDYTNDGTIDGVQNIPCSCSTIEPYANFAAKVA